MNSCVWCRLAQILPKLRRTILVSIALTTTSSESPGTHDSKEVQKLEVSVFPPLVYKGEGRGGWVLLYDLMREEGRDGGREGGRKGGRELGKEGGFVWPYMCNVSLTISPWRVLVCAYYFSIFLPVWEDLPSINRAEKKISYLASKFTGTEFPPLN